MRIVDRVSVGDTVQFYKGVRKDELHSGVVVGMWYSPPTVDPPYRECASVNIGELSDYTIMVDSSRRLIGGGQIVGVAP